MKAVTKRLARLDARRIESDIRRMRRIQADAKWLNHRDTNISAAADLTHAISVLAAEAIRLHAKEHRRTLKIARSGDISGY